MPDLAFDMATSFDTNVNIYLHKSAGKATGAYRTSHGFVTAQDLENQLQEDNGLLMSGIQQQYQTLAHMGFIDTSKLNSYYTIGSYDDGSGNNNVVYPVTTITTGENGEEITVYVDPNYVDNMDYTVTEPEDGEWVELNNLTGQTTWLNMESIRDYYESYADRILEYTNTNDESILEELEAEGFYLSGNPNLRENFIFDEENLEELRNVNEVMNEIRDEVTDDNYKAYIPYIASVTDHWYRDVYWVVEEPNKEFVDLDYNYEATMRERWTLYETYSEDENPEKAGEYKLYRVNDDGSIGELYDGTQEEANSEEIKVIKNAKMVGADLYGDLLWGQNEDSGVWSAYNAKIDKNKTFGGTYEPVNFEKDDNNEKLNELRKNVYVKVDLDAKIKQTGEGQRVQTNEKIKKMFTTNKYFRYEGDRKTAEIITALRGNNYGPVDENTNAEINYEGETYKASDYISNVSLNQDSLTAFNILENTHTLDSDYIYRDFKELMVELGYFTKEELTDETPRLLEFLVPSVGSYGYPYRPLDKNENEYGTMIHSNGDMSVMMGDMNDIRLEALENAINNAFSNQDGGPSSDNTSTSTSSSGHLVSLGSSGSGSGDLLSLEEWWEEIDKMMTVFTEEHWTYQMVHDYGSFDEAHAAGAYHTDCSLFASWALQKLGALEEGQTFSSHIADNLDLNGEDQGVAQSLLDAGAEVIVVNGAIGSEDELEPGDVVFFDDNVGHVTIYYGEGPLCYDAGSDYWNRQQEPINYNNVLTRHCTIILRFPFGKPKEDEKEETYFGYMGNEAVVSPVTGILLEYGQYNGSQEDSISHEKYRTNVDLKYNVGEENTDGANEENIQNAPYDKVGYAKIFVLDKSTYMQMPGALGYGINENGNLVDEFAGQSVDDLEDFVDGLDDTQKTILGYKEFLEDYEYAGIAGHIVYIDGFVCQYPQLIEETEGEEGELTSGETGADNNMFIPNGEPISMATFTGLSGAAPDETNSEYKADKEHKLASALATERLKAEIAIKDEAAVAFYTGGNVKVRLTDPEKEGKDESEEVEYPGIFIKEGTVIGRTMTDYELLTGGIREGGTMTYEEARPPKVENENAIDGEEKEEKNGKLIGNYLRIIMLENTSRDEVENVEDYMKLDDGIKDKDKKSLGNIEEYMYWMAMEPEGFHCEFNNTIMQNGHKCRIENGSDSHGVQYAVCNGGANDLNLCPGIYLGNGQEILNNQIVQSKGQIIMYETWFTGDELLEVYEAELLDINGEAVKRTTNMEFEEDDTRLYALIDVMYAGPGEFARGTLLNTLRQGEEPTVDDFISTTLGGAFDRQNHNAMVNRRICDYYIYTEGIYGCGVYGGGEYPGHKIKEYYEFTSDTPFQDLMEDINSGEPTAY